MILFFQFLVAVSLQKQLIFFILILFFVTLINLIIGSNNFLIHHCRPRAWETFCKVPENKCFRLCRPYMVFITIIQFCLCSVDVIIDSTYVSEHGYVPVKLFMVTEI